MVDLDTFLITLYVEVDEFCKQLALPLRRGPRPALSRSESLTLAIVGQWARFRSERDFYRFAQQRLRPYFPTLPARSQFNRQQRQLEPLLVSLSLAWAACLQETQPSAYEILDRCGLSTRHVARRGPGWLAGYTATGHCSRLGFFHGVALLSAVDPRGVLTGYGLASASVKEHAMAESLFAQRTQVPPPLASAGACVGGGYYVLDRGFSGPHRHQQWHEAFGVEIVCAPQQGHGPLWPRLQRLWLIRHRQVIETVHEKLLHTFRLERERPHTIEGLRARLAAKAALHNLCILLNRALGRPDLAFADLLGW
jgi:hypothetical protein